MMQWAFVSVNLPANYTQWPTGVLQLTLKAPPHTCTGLMRTATLQHVKPNNELKDNKNALRGWLDSSQPLSYLQSHLITTIDNVKIWITAASNVKTAKSFTIPQTPFVPF